MDILPNETIQRIEEQSIIYKVGQSIKNQILVGVNTYDSNNLIDFNKITKDFQAIDIPLLDSLIRK